MTQQLPAPSGHEDPPGEAPWAMQLVVRAERDRLPSVSAVCEAAASATVRLLADPRSAPAGEWHPRIDRWLAGRIRKIVRRARGAAFERAREIEGVSVSHRGAQVHACVPGATDAVPAALSKLQVSGLVLEDPDRVVSIELDDEPIVVVSFNPAFDLHEHPGKAAAQAAHAAQLAWMAMDEPRRGAWERTGWRVAVEWPTAEDFEQLEVSAPVLVVDAGFTVVPAASKTTTARWH